jgi:hypothetical protein
MPTAETAPLVAQFAQLTSGDEVWCDPTTIRCFATGLTDPANAANTRVLGVIDFNGAVPNLIQPIATFNGDHSVAVDPISGEIFVPTGGAVAGSACPLGRVLVFVQAAAVPGAGFDDADDDSVRGVRWARLVAAPTPVLDRT